MLAQFSTAIGALVGCLMGLLAKDMAESTAWVLPLTAGGFIYIATTTVCVCVCVCVWRVCVSHMVHWRPYSPLGRPSQEIHRRLVPLSRYPELSQRECSRNFRLDDRIQEPR